MTGASTIGHASLGGPVVSWRDGIHIEAQPGAEVWCDASRARDLCFLSSAQVLHQLRLPDALLCGERAWRFHCLLHPDTPPPPSLLLSPTGRPFQLGALRMELFPSGLLPGATSLWLRTQEGGQIVYAGAPNPVLRPTCEAMQVRAADTLIVHAPLSLADVTLPSRSQALSALRAQIDQAAAQDEVTVILCAPLTTAPDLADALSQPPAEESATGYPLSLYAHAQIVRACAAYRDVGALPSVVPAGAPPLRRLRGPLLPGAVLLWPVPSPAAQPSSGGPSRPGAAAGGIGGSRGDALPAAATLLASSARGVRIVLCSAMAALPALRDRVDAQLAAQGLDLSAALLFPDAIDRAGLLQYVRDCGARRVYVTGGGGGGAAALAAQLGSVSVAFLGPPSQLALFSG